MKNLFKIEEYLYIVSHSESIKENDYIVTKDGRLIEVSYLLSKDLENAFKVILSDNPELIKNGVQSIDDDFLEWFVSKANDSGKAIDIVEVEKMINVLQLTDREYCYKPIIPQPKQETIEEVALKEYPVYIHYGEATVLHDANEEQREAFTNGWIECLKHQSEKMFSLEDMEKAFNQGAKFNQGRYNSEASYNPFNGNQKENRELNFPDWLTQHKKH